MTRFWFTTASTTRTAGPTLSRRWRSTLVALATGLAMVAVSPAHAAAGARPRQALPATTSLQQLLNQIVAGGAPGAIGLVWDGNTIERAASGVADLRTHRAMRVDDRFRVGSITKTFVATVVLQLVGEGRLRLDDPVDRWLPGLDRRDRGA